MYRLKPFHDLSSLELYKIISLRELVFVVEQNCPYLDCDGLDLNSMHLWMEKEETIVAYTRLVPPKKENGLWSIGRVVVHPDFRTLGLGIEVMRKSIQHLSEVNEVECIEISAQVYLTRFYNNLGFIEVGEPYLEDNIPHIRMLWDKRS